VFATHQVNLVSSPPAESYCSDQLLEWFSSTQTGSRCSAAIDLAFLVYGTILSHSSLETEKKLLSQLIIPNIYRTKATRLNFMQPRKKRIIFQARVLKRP
jgi:hypothetical protein